MLLPELQLAGAKPEKPEDQDSDHDCRPGLHARQDAAGSGQDQHGGEQPSPGASLEAPASVPHLRQRPVGQRRQQPLVPLEAGPDGGPPKKVAEATGSMMPGETSGAAAAAECQRNM